MSASVQSAAAHGLGQDIRLNFVFVFNISFNDWWMFLCIVIGVGVIRDIVLSRMERARRRTALERD